MSFRVQIDYPHEKVVMLSRILHSSPLTLFSHVALFSRVAHLSHVALSSHIALSPRIARRAFVARSSRVAILAAIMLSVACSGQDDPGSSSDTKESTDGSTDDGSGADGGSGNSNGSTASEGSSGQGSGSCSYPIGACSAPSVRLSEIDLGVPLMEYGSEWDTLPLPYAIAPRPGGGSWLAALSTEEEIVVARLDCDDKIIGSPLSFPASDLQDIIADDDGAVLLLTRAADGSGEHGCGSDNLCGGESAPCEQSLMLRFNNEGAVEWETPVTNLTSSQSGYENGARFVWRHYQHHGRLAASDTHYAAYFSIAITVDNNSCVDIHQGDRMQVVSRDGSPEPSHPDSFEVGCSHSWNNRLVWDERNQKFTMVCATDNGCRISQPNPYRTVREGSCDGTLFGGDLTLAQGGGYFTVWSQGGQIQLDHFNEGASDFQVENLGTAAHPHLAPLGEAQLLLSYEDGEAMSARVLDAASGEPISETFSIDVADHNYIAWKGAADGSALYPARGASSSQVEIARVFPCLSSQP